MYRILFSGQGVQEVSVIYVMGHLIAINLFNFRALSRILFFFPPCF